MRSSPRAPGRRDHAQLLRLDQGQLTRYGGMGYGHVLTRIAPLLAGLGVDDARLHDMLVARPVALLDRTEILS